MISISKEFEFSAGHTITDHSGKCARLHGHNYRLIVHLATSGELNEMGMVMDFGDLKDIVKDITNEYDHRFLIWRQDPRAESLQLLDQTVILFTTQPTAENILLDIMSCLHARFLPLGFLVTADLWETETSYASAG